MVKVDQEHVDDEAQCTTCLETFELDEDVAKLNCKVFSYIYGGTKDYCTSRKRGFFIIISKYYGFFFALQTNLTKASVS
jgi:hypothetical protein